MKRFLVILVAIITAVCIGITFYQFAKNDEVIKVDTQTIYVNYGDKLSLDDIGFSRREASKETKINFNAGGDEVTSIIKYDDLSGCYIPTAKGGATTIKISTTNRKYKSFSIDVVVGIGTEEFPYYITNENQLTQVCNSHIDENACFELINDIELTKAHTPIGLIDGEYREFTGKFNGDYHTISNLTFGSCDFGGLFAILGASSEVYNLNIDNANINGSFINVGAVAGTCYGTINKVIVSNANIANNKSSGNTGAVVGLLKSDNLNNTTAGILRTSAYTDENTLITATGTLGGLVGSMDSAIMHACYSKLQLRNESNSITGGLVGNVTVNENTYIRESYSVCKISSGNSSISGNIAGSVSLASDVTIDDITKELVFVGLYYQKSLNPFNGIGDDVCGFESTTNFAINGKTETQMKNRDTYIYYINSSTNIVYWDKVWYLVDGQYPTLTFINKFDDVVLDDENNTTTPDDPIGPDISNPDTPSISTTVISNKEELIAAFQGKDSVNGNYILNADIDLGGYAWIPVKFSGTFKSNDGQNHAISNFKIAGNDLLYAGFFYNLASSTISNITFSNISVQSTGNETIGIVVGHIRGNVKIENVNVINSTINTSTKYSGGIAGYISNVITVIENCDVRNITINNALNAGAIAGYTSDSSYIISCNAKNLNTIKAIERIGGIVAVNHGTIYECSFNGNIETINSLNAGYFGGLVGVNYSAITDSVSYAEITIVNPTSSSNGIHYFVGGLVGYNLGNIVNSSIYADSITTSQSTGIVYVAGLTGYNSGKLEYCVSNITNIGSVNNSIYTAGLSVFNYGGNILGCFNFGNLNGYQVAGLVRTNTNDAIIDSCMSSLNEFDRATFKGVQLASFVYEISSGNIANCLVNANLNCVNDAGWTAGFAGFMPYTNGKFGTISNNIANVSFNGVGKKYLDIAGAGLMKKDRTTGTITKCIISEDAKVADVIVSEYSKFLWNTKEPGSGSNYKIADNEKLKSLELYLDSNSCNFDISAGLTDSKWLYINNQHLPIPRAYVEIFGYDIVGLG